MWSNVDVVTLSYLKLFIFYWDWILLLIVSSSWNFYNKTNWAGVGQSALKSVPSFWVPSLLFFPVYCSRLCSIHKRWDLVFIAENSLKGQIRMALVAFTRTQRWRNSNLFDLRTQGIAVLKSAVHVQLRHLAVWLMLLLLLKTHPIGQV